MHLSKILFLCLFTVSFSALAQAEDRTAEQVYNTSCATCHNVGIANAPKVHDAAAWKTKAKSVDDMLSTAKTGLNAMPPKGLCSDCSDAELRATIEYMIKPANE